MYLTFLLRNYKPRVMGGGGRDHKQCAWPLPVSSLSLGGRVARNHMHQQLVSEEVSKMVTVRIQVMLFREWCDQPLFPAGECGMLRVSFYVRCYLSLFSPS